MSGASSQSFGKWREKIWPFHGYELKKMLPLILMKFLVSLNYGLLTCLKDTVVVHGKGGGAEVITVLKGYVVLPIALLMTILYSKLSNMVKKTTLFYTFIGGFLAVIFLLGFVFYPNLDTFSPNASADALSQLVGSRFSSWIAAYRNWIQTSIFVTAELWGSMVILLMFWGFANHITNMKEAKKSYTIYIAAGDFAAILIGPITTLIAKLLGHRDFAVTVQVITTILLLVGGLLIGIYWWTNRYVLTDSRFFDPKRLEDPIKKKKEKPSLMQSFKMIAKSKYLYHIAVLVIAYGLTISMIEITWKAHLKMYYPNKSDYQAVMGQIFSLVGTTSLIVSLFFCGNMMRRLGWHFTAQIAPFVLGITGLMFFFIVIYQDALSPFFLYFGMKPIAFIVMFGAFQNIVAKVMKYSFFDPTKEIAYIPLSEEEKVKGKASIDVVGSRLGKSGSSWIQSGLIASVGMGSILGTTSYLLPIIILVVIGWSYSVKCLNYHLHARSKNEKLIEETSAAL